MSRQAVSLSEDVDDHSLVWNFEDQTLLGDVAGKVVSQRYLPHMVGSAWPLSLLPPAPQSGAAAVVAVFVQRPLGVTKIVPLELPRLATPLVQLGQWTGGNGGDGLLELHCGYSPAGRLLSPGGLQRLLRR